MATAQRRIASAFSKQAGQVAKFGPTVRGSAPRSQVAQVGGSQFVGVSSFPTPGPTAPVIPLPAFPTGFIPGTPPADFFQQQTGGGGGGLLNLGCQFLPESLRATCEAITGGGDTTGGTEQPSTCPEGSFKVGNKCVALGDLFPGGDPMVFTPGSVTPSSGVQVVAGGFGLPAAVPASIPSVRRKCGRGMVLGIDDLCYPKAVLTSRSKLRKWRRPPKPPISRRDVVAIRRASSAKDRVSDLAKDVGLFVAKTRPRSKSAAAKHHEK